LERPHAIEQDQEPITKTKATVHNKKKCYCVADIKNRHLFSNRGEAVEPLFRPAESTAIGMATVNLQASELEPLARLLPEEGVLPRVKAICSSKDQAKSAGVFRLYRRETKNSRGKKQHEEPIKLTRYEAYSGFPEHAGGKFEQFTTGSRGFRTRSAAKNSADLPPLSTKSSSRAATAQETPTKTRRADRTRQENTPNSAWKEGSPAAEEEEAPPPPLSASTPSISAEGT
jgi:hypothetical protein